MIVTFTPEKEEGSKRQTNQHTGDTTLFIGTTPPDPKQEGRENGVPGNRKGHGHNLGNQGKRFESEHNDTQTKDENRNLGDHHPGLLGSIGIDNPIVDIVGYGPASCKQQTGNG